MRLFTKVRAKAVRQEKTEEVLVGGRSGRIRLSKIAFDLTSLVPGEENLAIAIGEMGDFGSNEKHQGLDLAGKALLVRVDTTNIAHDGFPSKALSKNGILIDLLGAEGLAECFEIPTANVNTYKKVQVDGKSQTVLDAEGEPVVDQVIEATRNFTLKFARGENGKAVGFTANLVKDSDGNVTGFTEAKKNDKNVILGWILEMDEVGGASHDKVVGHAGSGDEENGEAEGISQTAR